MLAKLRAFFAEREALEVETPALSAAAATDVHIDSIVVADADGTPRGFLHTSPEFPMKRLLAAGIGDCWQLARVFRAGELGRRHNPEFSLVEWYRVGWSAHDLMDEVADLVGHLLEGLRPLGPVVRMTYRDAVITHAGVDPFSAPTRELVEALATAGIDPPEGLGRDECLDLLLGAVVEPALDPDCPTFVHDFPASHAALARIRPEDPPVAERFELFLGGMELANGFAELTDAQEQSERFESDLARRRDLGRTLPRVDERFLSALASGLPECAGVALGFDRLVMLAAHTDSIRDVLAFPADLA